MLTNVLKLPVKVLTGYNGNDDQLAMRRGEITGTLALAFLLGAVREERLWPLHRPDRRQPDNDVPQLATWSRTRPPRRWWR